MLYVGVDAHKERSHITVRDEDGKVRKRTRVESSRQGGSKRWGDG